jgi:hypothetical protein
MRGRRRGRGEIERGGGNHLNYNDNGDYDMF